MSQPHPGPCWDRELLWVALVSLLGTAGAADSCGMVGPAQCGGSRVRGRLELSRAGMGTAPKGSGLSTGSLQHLQGWVGALGHSQALPLGMLEARRGFGGQGFGGAVAAAGQEADMEPLLNILPFASCFICIVV